MGWFRKFLSRAEMRTSYPAFASWSATVVRSGKNCPSSMEMRSYLLVEGLRKLLSALQVCAADAFFCIDL